MISEQNIHESVSLLQIVVKDRHYLKSAMHAG